jgi:mannose-6-phosphate isomerase-like protein (cupin superfamily)
MNRIFLLGFSVALAACSFGACAQSPVKTGEYRRVVTKLDDNGRAVVMIDERAPVTAGRSANGVADAWATTRSPAQLSFAQDLGQTKVGIAPPRGGTSFRVVDFAPTTEAISKLPLDMVMKLVGADAPKKGLPPIHPMMHRTRSVDYAVVVSGEIQMLLDDSTVTLRPGDVVVQQATNHAWINRSKEYARVIFVLVDAEEP